MKNKKEEKDEENKRKITRKQSNELRLT